MDDLSVPSADWVKQASFEGLSLKQDEIHLWKMSLHQSPQMVEEMLAILSVAECERADQFRFAELRAAYILGRGVLRTLLGWYLGLPPHLLTIQNGAHGKPFVETGGAGSFQFNQSHSHGLVVFAFAWDCPVGVDIELVRAIQRAECLANRFFSSKEYEQIQQTHGDLKEKTFFRAWTCKEAYLKATGEGLVFPLSRIEVSLGEDELLRLLKTPDDMENTWCVEAFEPEPGYVGALVYRQPHRNLRFLQV